jgi:hypothetical protein
MPDAKTFFDTNVLLYLLSEDAAKADRAEELIANGMTKSSGVGGKPKPRGLQGSSTRGNSIALHR